MTPLRTSFGASSARESAIPEFVRRVLLWMSAGLAITGVVAYGVASSPSLIRLVILNRPIFWVLIIAQLVLVAGISGAIDRMSAAVATGLFLLYSAMVGLTLSVIFFVYTLHSIGQVFFITAGTFAAFAVYGYVTKRDLTSMGQLFFMGVIGLVIASVVNFFLASDALSWAISVVGVVIFCGLTAYKMQGIKSYALSVAHGPGDEGARKYAIVGALGLYVTFINLFLMMLRLFGGRRN